MDIKTLQTNIANKLETIGYELVSLTSKVIKGDTVLEVVVDRVQPIDMDAIVEVSNVLNAYIDELDPFDHPYTLDISSLGAEKPLKIERLNEYVNSYVHVHLINPIDGENIFEGTLKEVNSESIKITKRIKTRSKDVEVIKTNILKIRLAIKF